MSERDALPDVIEAEFGDWRETYGFEPGDPHVQDARRLLVRALALGREQGRQEERERRPIMVDRDADLLLELRAYLDAQTISSENIGDVRRSLFMPWDSMWNGWVRDETAVRENKVGREGAGR